MEGAGEGEKAGRWREGPEQARKGRGAGGSVENGWRECRSVEGRQR
jgi:hypothetical protein